MSQWSQLYPNHSKNTSDSFSEEQLELAKIPDFCTIVLSVVVGIKEAARQPIAQAVNAIMTATYLEIGRSIVELKQKGENRAEYRHQIIERMYRT